jgi:hypothetical protein
MASLASSASECSEVGLASYLRANRSRDGGQVEPLVGGNRRTGCCPGGASAKDASLLLEGTHTVKLAALSVDDAETAVWLRLWPGDTLEQSKALYADADRVNQLLSLRDQGWTIAPNFHFGHLAKGFVWTTGDIGVDEYVSHWLAQIGASGQVRRAELEWVLRPVDRAAHRFRGRSKGLRLHAI